MRTLAFLLSSALVVSLTACPPPVQPTDDTDPVPDTDDTDVEPVSLTLDAEAITLLPGAATRVPWSARGGVDDVLPEARVDHAPCVTATVEADALRLEAPGGIAASCRVVLLLDDARASVAVTVEPDWGGRVQQWGEPVDWNLPDDVRLLESGHLLVATSHMFRGGERLSRVGRRDATGAPVGAPIEVRGERVIKAVRVGGVTWMYYRTADGQAEVVSALADGTLGSPVRFGEEVTHISAMGPWRDGVWVAGGFTDAEGHRGMFHGTLSAAGELEQHTLFPAEDSGLNLYGARRLDDGWLFHGLCYDHRAPCFPEAQGEDDWGSFILRTDEDLEPVWVQGLGPGNVQVQRTALLEDGRLLVAGWARGRYHVDEYTGGYDAVVELREPTGDVVWRRVWGGPQERSLHDFAIHDGEVFLIGTWAPAIGEPGRAWLVGLDLTDGSDVWEETLGQAGTTGWHVLPHGQGVVVAGTTDEVLGDTRYGETDAWLARYGWDGLPR